MYALYTPYNNNTFSGFSFHICIVYSSFATCACYCASLRTQTNNNRPSSHRGNRKMTTTKKKQRTTHKRMRSFQTMTMLITTTSMIRFTIVFIKMGFCRTLSTVTIIKMWRYSASPSRIITKTPTPHRQSHPAQTIQNKIMCCLIISRGGINSSTIR